MFVTKLFPILFLFWLGNGVTSLSISLEGGWGDWWCLHGSNTCFKLLPGYYSRSQATRECARAPGWNYRQTPTILTINSKTDEDFKVGIIMFAAHLHSGGNFVTWANPRHSPRPRPTPQITTPRPASSWAWALPALNGNRRVKRGEPMHPQLEIDVSYQGPPGLEHQTGLGFNPKTVSWTGAPGTQRARVVCQVLKARRSSSG